MNKNMLITMAATVAAIAMIYRIPKAKELLTGDSGSIFSF